MKGQVTERGQRCEEGKGERDGGKGTRGRRGVRRREYRRGPWNRQANVDPRALFNKTRLMQITDHPSMH